MGAKNRVVHRTAYPHIVKIDGVCGGQAIIEGTRITVWHIVGYYYKVGMSVEDILAEWNYLKPAQVFSALAYYHDNGEEIDKVREENSYEQGYHSINSRVNGRYTSSFIAVAQHTVCGGIEKPSPLAQ